MQTTKPTHFVRMELCCPGGLTAIRFEGYAVTKEQAQCLRRAAEKLGYLPKLRRRPPVRRQKDGTWRFNFLFSDVWQRQYWHLRRSDLISQMHEDACQARFLTTLLLKTLDNSARVQLI